MNEPPVIDLLTEIRDIQRLLLENDKVRIAPIQQQAELYKQNLEATERRTVRGIIATIVFSIAVFIMIFLFLSHR